MSDSHVDVVRRNSAAFSDRDVDGMLELFAPDAEVIDRRPVGWSEFRGHEQLRGYYQGIFDNAAALEEDLVVVAERGDVVLADCHTEVTLSSEAGSEELSFAYALAITFRGDLIARLEIYPDTEAARIDKGLE